MQTTSAAWSTTRFSAHFEVSGLDGGFPQPINFKTERYGGFVQASYIFGAPIVAAKY
jgi:hypothetical protein